MEKDRRELSPLMRKETGRQGSVVRIKPQAPMRASSIKPI